MMFEMVVQIERGDEGTLPPAHNGRAGVLSRVEVEQILHRAFDAMWQIHSDEGVPLRTAAYILALRRIAEARKSQGTREYFSGKSR